MKKFFVSISVLLFICVFLNKSGAQTFVNEWEGHNGPVNSVQFSRDGLKLLSAGSDGTIRMFNLTDNSLYKIIQSANMNVKSLVISDDGSMFAVIGDKNFIELYSYFTGDLLKSMKDTCRSICFSGDGKKIFSCGEKFKIWDLNSGINIKTLSIPLSNCIIGTKDVSKVLLAGDDSKIYLYDYNSAQIARIYDEHISAILGLSLSPDGTKFASSSADRTIRIWDLNNSASLKVAIAHLGYVYSIAYSGDGTKLVTACEDTRIRLYGTNPVDVLHTYWGHVQGVYSAAFSPNGEKIASAGYDGIIRLWDTMTDSYLLLESISSHTGIINNIEYSKDDYTLITSGYDNIIDVWDPAMGFQLKKLSGHTDTITSLHFYKDRNTIISGSMDGRIRLWDVSLGKTTLSINNSSPVLSICTNKDYSKIFSSGMNGVLKAFDSKGIFLKRIDSSNIPVRAMAFSNIRNVLIAGDDEGKVRFYNADNYLPGNTYNLNGNVRKIIVSGDGGYIFALLGSGRISEINTSNGVIRSFDNSDPVSDFSFSAPRLALILQGGTVKFIRQSDFVNQGTFEYSSGYPDRIAFNSEGSLVALGGWGVNNIKIKELITVLSAENKQTIPNHFVLYQNYPNPFNPSTNIRFGLNTGSSVSFEVYNILGELVNKKVLTNLEAGEHIVSWNPGNLSGGIYFYVISNNVQRLSGKMVYLK